MLRNLTMLQFHRRVVRGLDCFRSTGMDRESPGRPAASPDRKGRLVIVLATAGLLAACAAREDDRAYSLSGKYITGSNTDEYYQKNGEWSGVFSQFTRIIMSGHWVSEDRSPTSKSICVTVDRSNFKSSEFVGKTICRTMDFDRDRKIHSYHFMSPAFPMVFEAREISE